MDYNFSDKIRNLRPSAIREIFKSLTDPSVISLAAGNPAPESFPADDLAALSAEIYRDNAATALQYGITEGYSPLREAVSARLRDRFGIGRAETLNDTTIITSGGQQAIELACKVFCNEGDTVICEDPSFIGALNAFRSCGAKTVGVPLHDDGIDPAELERVIAANPRAKMIYLIPTFQNPSGITMSAEKRRAVYEIAKKHSLVIFEDNPYGELRFSGGELPALKSMDDAGIVIYCSSFSKILSAGMRIGFVCAPGEIIGKMVVAKQSEDVHTNLFFQMLCHKFITERDLDAHIAKIRDLYARKCTHMIGCLEKYMPREVTFTRPEGGLFIWCTLPDRTLNGGEIDMNEYVRAAVAAKVAVVPGNTFNCDPAAPSKSFRLNYSTPSDEQIDCGVGILGKIAREFLNK